MAMSIGSGRNGGMNLRRLRATAFRAMHLGKPTFECPICGYRGPFRDIRPATGERVNAKCACCGALERHRLQHLVMERVSSSIDTRAMRMLHFAPEDFFRARFAGTFGTYETADLSMPGVDHHVDLQSLPFASGSFDIVYASHVLEHVPDDRAAIAEIRRILAPGGIAILPVPLVAPATIEYAEPNPMESGHVRAPGPDYFDRYRAHFAKVELHASEDFPERFQLFVHEERPAGNATRNRDIVPVCHA